MQIKIVNHHHITKYIFWLKIFCDNTQIPFNVVSPPAAPIIGSEQLVSKGNVAHIGLTLSFCSSLPNLENFKKSIGTRWVNEIYPSFLLVAIKKMGKLCWSTVYNDEMPARLWEDLDKNLVTILLQYCHKLITIM